MAPQRSGRFWRSSVKDDRGLRVRGEAFDAITVETDARRVWLYIGGLPTEQVEPFTMPADPEMLRDLAEALKRTADEIQQAWEKRCGGGPFRRPPVSEEEL